MFTKKHPRSKRSLRRIVAKKTQEAELLLNLNDTLENSTSILTSPQPSCYSSSNIDISDDLTLFEVNPTMHFAQIEQVELSQVHFTSMLSATSNKALTLAVNEDMNNASGHSDMICRQAHLDLRKWAVYNKISHSALNDLLKNVLAKNFPQTRFPSDTRTLLRTSEKLFDINISQNYCYFGIQKSINYLIQAHNVKIIEGNTIELAINVDGLPLTKRKKKICKFNPIQGCNW